MSFAGRVGSSCRAEDQQPAVSASGSLLQSYRVLDLADEQGTLCAKILGDLGADVIKVECPSGDSARRFGPFYHDEPHPERSLQWFAFNTNKRSVTLDLVTRDGRAIFKRLVRTCDFLVESFPPGTMAQLGLSYGHLSSLNPRLIMVSITPFGQSGPYRDFKSTDLTNLAMGGFLYVCGSPETPPVRISVPQSYLHASGNAALGALVALSSRTATGLGDHVDVSIQESMVWTPLFTQQTWHMNGLMERRGGVFRQRADTGIMTRYIWPCKDGWVSWLILGGSAVHFQRSLALWMREAGYGDDFLDAMDWGAFDFSTVTQETMERISAPIYRFFSAHSKEYLWLGAQERGLPIYVVSSPGEIVRHPQLAARNYWVLLDHPLLGQSVKYPGAFVSGLDQPCGVWRRAPTLGEHNTEVYGDELGYSRSELVSLRQAKVI